MIKHPTTEECNSIGEMIAQLFHSQNASLDIAPISEAGIKLLVYGEIYPAVFCLLITGSH